MSDLSAVEKFIVEMWPTVDASPETWRRILDDCYAIYRFGYRTDRLSFDEVTLLRDVAEQASARYQLIFFDQIAELDIREKAYA